MAPDELVDLDEFVEVANEDAADHAESAVELLLHFGAARTAPGRNPGGTVAITPLGDLLARSITDAFAPSAEVNASEAVLAVTPLMPDEPTVARRLTRLAAQPWVEARGPVGAARELLAFAENAEPAQRFAALEIAQGLGYEAAEAWRELARKAGFGAYGRQWLARAGEHVPADENDEAWLLVETLLKSRDKLPDAFLPVVFLSLMHHVASTGMSAEALLAGIAGCGHPGGPEMARLLSGGRFRAGPLTSPAASSSAAPWTMTIMPPGMARSSSSRSRCATFPSRPSGGASWSRTTTPWKTCTTSSRSRWAGTTPTCTSSGRGTRTTG